MPDSSNSLPRRLLSQWARLAAAFLTAAMLYPFILWTEEEQVLLPETLLTIKWSLLLSMAAECLLPIHWLPRRLIQLIVLPGLTLQTAGPGLGVFLSAGFWEDLRHSMPDFLPYTAFGMGIWLAYLGALWWFKVKGRIYLFLLIGIVALAIRDSFSQLVLWDQTAALAVCGIAMIIVRHFESLKQRDPASWNYLAEYPGSVITPVVVLILLTLGIGIAAPSLPPLVTDPYTAWKTWKGEQVSASGKGIYEIAEGLADSSSGYARNDSELGGGFNYDFAPVMTVDTTQKGYWRGEIKTFYTGKGWEDGPGDRVRNDAADIGAPLNVDPSVNESKLRTVEAEQTFTLLNDQRYPVLFGAFAIDRLLEVDGSPSRPETGALRWSARSGELGWYAPGKGYPKEYKVVSRMPVIDEDAIRKATMNAYRSPEWQNELQLPDTLPQRVRQLAEEITRNAANPYDKVKAIEQYLSTTYPYTNRPKLSRGHSKDFVDRFLFEIKEGYCDYYSTAMVVMTRSIGIPARWVKGFVSGTLPEEEMEATLGLPEEELNPTGAGTYTVRNADAHSWVEVYFDGWGWIPFEPTAGFSLPVVKPQDEAEPVALPDPSTGTPSAGAGNRLEGMYGLWMSTFAALLLAGGILFLWRTGRLPDRLPGKRAGLSDVNHRIVCEFNRFMKYSRRKGFVRYEHETARETIRRWSEQDERLKEDLDALLTSFELAKYGGSALTEADWNRASGILGRLRSGMKR